MKWNNIENKYFSHLDNLKHLSSYELLEVETSVTLTELKNAYRKKIKLYHPDSADKFMKELNLEISKLINDAYNDILKNINE